MTASAIAAITAVQAPLALDAVALQGPTPGVQQADFGTLVLQGLQKVNQSLATADATLQAVAAGQPVPPHQAMLAMEQARMDLQLALQVRSRLVEGMQELMRMQL